MLDDLGSLLRIPIELTGKYCSSRIKSPPSLVLLLIAMGLQTSLQLALMMGGRLIAMGLQTSLQLAPMMGGKLIAMRLQTSLQSAPMMGGRLLWHRQEIQQWQMGLGWRERRTSHFW
jgi:hypothetical protein